MLTKELLGQPASPPEPPASALELQDDTPLSPSLRSWGFRVLEGLGFRV